MIAKLSGLLDSVADNFCILDVNGVGYQVFCSARTLRNLPRPGEALRLHIETHVREEHIHLFGFVSASERECFNLLQTVQGVGAKVALGILSTLAPDELFRAIASADKTSLNRCDGVGPKLAVRLITELKDKVGGIALGPVASATPAEVAMENANGPVADALSALVNLGYKRADAFGAVTTAARNLGDKANVQQLIPAALKELAR